MAGTGSTVRPRLPPVALVALALIIGSASYAVLDVFFPPAFSLAIVCLPILPWLRPDFLWSPRTVADTQEFVEVLPRFVITVHTGTMSAALALAMLAGGLTTYGQRRGVGGDCRLRLTDGVEGPVSGWFEGGTGTGARPFRLVHGLNCEGSVRAFQRGSEGGYPPGTPVSAVGIWRRAAHPIAAAPASAGTLLLADVQLDENFTGFGFAGARARLRGRIESRMRDLLPETWPLASALILARKEALDPAVREAFAVAGIAHLLAISGFHVGVVALLVSVLIRGRRGRPAPSPGLRRLHHLALHRVDRLSVRCDPGRAHPHIRGRRAAESSSCGGTRRDRIRRDHSVSSGSGCAFTPGISDVVCRGARARVA